MRTTKQRETHWLQIFKTRITTTKPQNHVELNLNNTTHPKQSITLSGGCPIDGPLGGRGESYRLLVLKNGYIDIVDCSQSGDMEYCYDIYFNGIRVQKLINGGVDFVIDITINNDLTFCINQDGRLLTGNLKTYPVVDETDIDSFNWMISEKYIPYQKIPDAPGRSTEQIKALGLQYFPFSKYSFQLAVSLYDWTTADFTRIDFFSIFVYSDVSGKPLDLNSIAQAIWTANWPPYTPQDIYYMNSFMMIPANSLEEVKRQLVEKASSLQANNLSEMNIIEAALKSMPRTSIIKVPKLFSGQVSISNLGTEHFAPYFEEFPYNATSGKPLEMPLKEALNTFIKTGKSLTLKNFVSFTDSLEDAMHYSNGIVLIVSPKQESRYWKHATYITPLSDGPEKTEYLVHPKTRFFIKAIEKRNVNNKEIVVIELQIV